MQELNKKKGKKKSKDKIKFNNSCNKKNINFMLKLVEINKFL